MQKQFIIYGATGNLSKLYLMPELYRLWRQGEAVKIIAVGLENFSTEEFCQNIFSGMKEKGTAPEGIDEHWELFSQSTIVYISLDLQEANYELPAVA